jgi:hypothetical protein
MPVLPLTMPNGAEENMVRKNDKKKLAKEEGKVDEADIHKVESTRVEIVGDLKDLIEKNIKWSQVIYNQNKQIKHRLTMITLLSWLKVLIILVPIIVAFVYLPAFLRDAWSQYGDLLGAGTGGGSLGNILNQLNTDQIQEALQSVQGQ